MGLLEKMENELESAEVIFQTYIASKSVKDIFLFFEGKDDYKYYVSRVSQYIQDKEYGVFCCKSKMNVLKVQEMITTQAAISENKKTLYFVDCDYDRNENIPERVYITSSYSIENYYVTDAAIRRIVIGVIGVSEEDENDKIDFEQIYKLLIAKRNDIIEEIIYANAWYSLQIKKATDDVIYPKLAPIKNYQAVKNINEIKLLESLTKNSVEITEIELYEEIEKLRKNPVEKIRGKYLIQALTPFLKGIFNDAGKKRDRQWFIKKRKISINLSDILLELSACADTPPELLDYINCRLS